MIKFKVMMADKKGQLIPSGVTETLSVEVYPGWAVFHFKDVNTTKRFALLSKEIENKGLEKTKTSYNERLQKYVTLYDGWSEEQIYDKLVKSFEGLGGVLK